MTEDTFTEELRQEIRLYQGQIVLLGRNEQGLFNRVVWSFPPYDTFGVYDRFQRVGLQSPDYFAYTVPLDPLDYSDLIGMG